MACALPAGNEGFQSSDIDVFIAGLNQQAALEKLAALYRHFQRAVGQGPILTVRTNNAVTFAFDHPRRHVQIILRLYRSVAEICLGFDVDSSAVAFDGSRLIFGYRAVKSFRRRINTIDVTRRSYTYETRLLKYAQRGFACLDRDLNREFINVDIYKEKFHMVSGLARLLLLEYRLGNQERLLQQTELPNRAQRYQGNAPDEYERFVAMIRAKDNVLAGQIQEFQMEERKSVEEYNSVFLPWGPGISGRMLEQGLKGKHIALNADGKGLCPAFWAWSLAGVEQDRWSLTSYRGGMSVARPVRNTYVCGELSFLAHDPGQQMIGSFHAHTLDDWVSDAYYPIVIRVKRRDWWSKAQLQALQTQLWRYSGRQLDLAAKWQSIKIPQRSPEQVRSLLMLLRAAGRLNFEILPDKKTNRHVMLDYFEQSTEFQMLDDKIKAQHAMHTETLFTRTGVQLFCGKDTVSETELRTYLKIDAEERNTFERQAANINADAFLSVRPYPLRLADSDSRNYRDRVQERIAKRRRELGDEVDAVAERFGPHKRAPRAPLDDDEVVLVRPRSPVDIDLT